MGKRPKLLDRTLPRPSPSWSRISSDASGSLSASFRAKRTLTASATRCCCAPSCRLRSIWRRAASEAATMRARDSCSSSAWWRSSSSDSLEGGVELDVVQRQPDLAGQLGQHRVVVDRELVGVGGPHRHDQPEHVARVGGRGHPQDGGSRPCNSAGQPNLSQAVPVTPARATTDSSSWGHIERDHGDVGHRHRPLEAAVGPGPHLGRGQPQRLAQRLGHLEERARPSARRATAGSRRCAARCRGASRSP